MRMFTLNIYIYMFLIFKLLFNAGTGTNLFFSLFFTGKNTGVFHISKPNEKSKFKLKTETKKKKKKPELLHKTGTKNGGKLEILV